MECWRERARRKRKGVAPIDERAPWRRCCLVVMMATAREVGVSWNKASYRKMAERRKRRRRGPRRRELEPGRKEARKMASQIDNKNGGITRRGSHGDNPRLRSRWLHVGEGGDGCKKRESRNGKAERSRIVGRRSRGG